MNARIRVLHWFTIVTFLFFYDELHQNRDNNVYFGKDVTLVTAGICHITIIRILPPFRVPFDDMCSFFAIMVIMFLSASKMKIDINVENIQSK